VAYSERVREELRNLLARAAEAGLLDAVAAAAREMDRVLRIYPQIGQPLSDLHLDPARIWIAVFPPQVVRYFLDEEQRLVMVVVPIQPLPHLGL
jgi:hypothetical protein